MDTAKRAELVELMDWIYARRARVHYPPIVHGRIIRQELIHDIRSVAELKRRIGRAEGLTVDCSQMVTALLLAVGAHNPNGGDTDGYTGTLLANLPHYTDPRRAYPGALAVFGPGTGHHVAMVRSRDVVAGNPGLFSQGQESDPRLIPLHTEALFQPHPVVLLSIAHL